MLLRLATTSSSYLDSKDRPTALSWTRSGPGAERSAPTEPHCGHSTRTDQPTTTTPHPRPTPAPTARPHPDVPSTEGSRRHAPHSTPSTWASTGIRCATTRHPSTSTTCAPAHLRRGDRCSPRHGALRARARRPRHAHGALDRGPSAESVGRRHKVLRRFRRRARQAQLPRPCGSLPSRATPDRRRSIRGASSPASYRAPGKQEKARDRPPLGVARAGDRGRRTQGQVRRRGRQPLILRDARPAQKRAPPDDGETSRAAAAMFGSSSNSSPQVSVGSNQTPVGVGP